jgi:diguanylate cyclase (GGDEF)-like protein
MSRPDAPPSLLVRAGAGADLLAAVRAQGVGALHVEDGIPDTDDRVWILDARAGLDEAAAWLGEARLVGIRAPAVVVGHPDDALRAAPVCLRLDAEWVAWSEDAAAIGARVMAVAAHAAAEPPAPADPVLEALFHATPFACLVLDAQGVVRVANTVARTWADAHAAPAREGVPFLDQARAWFGAPGEALSVEVAAALAGRARVVEFESAGVPYQCRFTPVAGSGSARVTVTCRDISRRRAAEARLRQQVTHDALTALPNRASLHERLVAGLQALRMGEFGAVGLLSVDVDRFKAVNDSLGLGTGDRLLAAFGARLCDVVGGEDRVARVGGDEFGVLVTLPPHDGNAVDAEVAAVAARIVEGARAPFVIDGVEVFVSATVGAAVATRAAPLDSDEMVRQAGLAMWSAKEAGGDRLEVYRDALDERARERLRLERDIRQALAMASFDVHFQPITDVAAGACVGVEALLRWSHPTRGDVPPQHFLPLCEELGLMPLITPFVLKRALEATAAWRTGTGGFREVPVHVNITASDVARPTFVDEVQHALDAARLPGAALFVELSESAVMRDPQRTADVLRALRDFGVRAAIDDFGTGTSSLSWLSRLPVSMLKVDGSFVRGEEDGGLSVVRSVLAFADVFGLDVVAEGVETAREVERLGAVGCTVVQGFRFASPMPESDVPAACLAK